MSNLPGLSIITNFAAFRRVATVPAPPSMGYFARGRQGYGDAGMAIFGWDPDSVAADDDSGVIKPDDRTATAGRWVRVSVGNRSLISYESLTFTRNTAAFETQPDGSLISRAINVPRMNADGYWQIEAAMNEQVRHNQDLSQAVWVKTNCTVSLASFTAPDGSNTARQITATAPGDMVIHQVQPARTGARANLSAYLRSDNGPHNVNVSLNDGSINANTTVAVGDSWQRVDVLLEPQAATPTARFTIAGAAAGARLSVWGVTNQFLTQVRYGHLPSHFPNAGAELTRGRDVLTGSAAQIPQRILDGTGGAWGIRFIPSFGIDGSQTIDHDHIDFVLFSFDTTGTIQEIVYGPPDGSVRDGRIWVRTTTSTAVAKSVPTPLSWNRGDLLEVHFSPSTGSIRTIGFSAGNGVQTNPPWVWTANTFQVGDRPSAPNTHVPDSFISEPFAVEVF